MSGSDPSPEPVAEPAPVREPVSEPEPVREPVSDPEPAPSPARRSGWRVAGRTASAVLLGFALLVAGLVVVLPAVAGGTTFTITGRSMEPAIPVGALIVTQRVDADEIAIGDVITFQLESGSPQVATHRVVGVNLESDRRAFITKGDANDAEDAEPVIVEQVRGRLWYAVPYVGWVNAVFSGSVRSWLIPAVAVALFAYAAWVFGSEWVRRSGRRSRAEPDASAPARGDQPGVRVDGAVGGGADAGAARGGGPGGATDER